MIENTKVDAGKVIDAEFVVKTTLTKKYTNAEVAAKAEEIIKEIEAIDKQTEKTNEKLARRAADKIVLLARLSECQSALVTLPKIVVVEEAPIEVEEGIV